MYCYFSQMDTVAVLMVATSDEHTNTNQCDAVCVVTVK